MVLDHVPKSAGLVIVMAAGLHPCLFGHGDLHVVNVAPVPDRLEKRVGKAEGENVLNRLLSEIMINAKDLAFVKEPGEKAVQFLGRVKIAAKGLSTTILACFRSVLSRALANPWATGSVRCGGTPR